LVNGVKAMGRYRNFGLSYKKPRMLQSFCNTSFNIS
jgi:hypothetical protein